MTFSVRDTCRLCDAKLPDERVLDLGVTALANALVREEDLHFSGGLPRMLPPENPPPPGLHATYPLYLKACSACGHVQLPIVVDPKLLFPADYPYQSATGKAMREHLDRMATELFRSSGASSYSLGFVAEIGSNDGYLLERFRSCGMRAIGIDPATVLASSATKNGDLTIPEFFNLPTAWAVRNACGQADLVVANNVFAHADDLHEIVEGVKVLLAAEGRFVFEVGYLPDVLRTNNFPVVYHEHLSYHSLSPLLTFFSRHGLNLYDAELIPTQGGSVRCYVRREADERVWPRSSRLVGLLSDGYPTLDGWQQRVNAAAGRFALRLRYLKSQGHSIAAFGCSAKSTTLLHVSGIGSETIDWIADDAPTKQGKFSPGKHIPIVPGSWLEEKQPDYCVSLSGNFSEAFKTEHPEFRGEWAEPALT